MINRHGAHGRAGAASYLERQAGEDELRVHHFLQIRQVLRVQHLALPARLMRPIALVRKRPGGIHARRIDADVDAAPIRQPRHGRLAQARIRIEPGMKIPAVIRLVVARPDENGSFVRRLQIRLRARLFQVRRLHPVLGVAEAG